MLVLCFTNTSNCNVYQAEVARAGTKSRGVASNVSIIGAVFSCSYTAEITFGNYISSCVQESAGILIC